MKSPELLRKIPLSFAPESCAVWRNHVLFCGLGGGISRLNTESGRITNVASDPYRVVCIEPSGKRFAASSAAYNRPVIHIFDRGTGKVVASLMGHRQEITDLRYHPDGSLLSVDSEGTFIRWKRNPGDGIALRTKFDSALRGSITVGSSGTVGVTLDESLVLLQQGGQKQVARFDDSRWVLNNTAYVQKAQVYASLNNLPKKRSLVVVSEKDLKRKEYPLKHTTLTKLFAVDDLLLATASDGFLYCATPKELRFTRFFDCGIEPLALAHERDSRVVHVVGGEYERGFLMSLRL